MLGLLTVPVLALLGFGFCLTVIMSLGLESLIRKGEQHRFTSLPSWTAALFLLAVGAGVAGLSADWLGLVIATSLPGAIWLACLSWLLVAVELTRPPKEPARPSLVALSGWLLAGGVAVAVWPGSSWFLTASYSLVAVLVLVSVRWPVPPNRQ